MDFRKYILRTPLIPYNSVNGNSECKIFLKPENLQVFGSYKIRGVASVIASAEALKLEKGLVTASAGNMAQAVAYAARELGISSRIYVPETAPEVKKSAIRRLGAQVIEKPFEKIWEIVRAGSIPGEEGLFIHPTLEPLTQGYASIVDEVIQDLPDFDAIVIPFGVGGLSLGIARRLRKLRSSAAMITVEPETAAPLNRSLSLKKPSQVERRPSFIDAIGTPEVLPSVFAELEPLISESLVVGIPEAEAAIAKIFRSHRMVIEGAAACALAAAERIADEGKVKKIVCVLSGGNINDKVFCQILLALRPPEIST